MKVLRFLGMGLCLGTLAAQSANGIACPTGGAKVKVIVNNPTGSTGQQITISGEQITGEATCSGASTSYNQVVNLYTTGDNEFIVPASSGVNSGMWKHHISTNVGGNQHQQKPVLFTSTAADYTKVPWTYHPTVINVNVTGDAGGSCSSSCTFRQALTRANSLIGASPAILIQFALSSPTTLTMTSSTDLGIGGAAHSPIITIDATDANGNPWIVGDALAAAQGNQDSFPVSIDLNNVTKLKVNGDNVRIKGLDIKNTVSSGVPTKNLIESAVANTRIEAVRLDGGAPGFCSPSNCSGAGRLLASLTGTGATLANVEARSAYGVGADLSGVSHEARDNWFHHNYIHDVTSDQALLSRNMMELSGRRLSDNAIVYNLSSGVMTTGTGLIQTSRNVIRNHTEMGVDVAASNVMPGTQLSGDYVCGNEFEGLVVQGGVGARASGTGMASVYNDDQGIRFVSTLGSGATMNFDNDSAYASNTPCGFKNDSSTITVNARNNQWRGAATGLCSASTDRCSGGTIDCDPVQDYVAMAVTIDTGQPTFPSNVILKGETVRVQGTGFNAIDGNPLDTQASPYDCAIGNSDVSSYNCCRKTAKANLCDASTSPGPMSSRGNCVALRNAAGAWKVLPVTGVTPTTIVSELPDTFACSGGAAERVRVSKMGTGGEIPDDDAYCLNAATL